MARDTLPVDGDCELHYGNTAQQDAPRWTLEQAVTLLTKKVPHLYTGTTQFYSLGKSEIFLPPRTHFRSHAITLGARSPIHFPQNYLIYRLFFEEARRQGAPSGYAHFGNDELGGVSWYNVAMIACSCWESGRPKGAKAG